jgi:hypothetical protein
MASSTDKVIDLDRNGEVKLIRRRSRFVTPGIKRLEISDGDWIEVKERLTIAEQESMLAAGVTSMISRDGHEDAREFGIDTAKFDLAKVKTWLVDWSFRDDDDKPVACTPSAVDNLDPADFAEIKDAIEAYQQELADLKNRTRLGPPS